MMGGGGDMNTALKTVVKHMYLYTKYYFRSPT